MMKYFTMMALIVFGLLALQPSTVEAGGCPQVPRLSPGGYGQIRSFPGVSNRIRSAPQIANNQIGSIPAGATFRVTNGPICDGYYNWWLIDYYGVVGYTAEATLWTYLAQPSASPPPPNPVPLPPPAPTCNLAARLSIGEAGTVVRGTPNSLRSQPSTATFSARVGEIPNGGTFNVLAGPQCAEGRNWWYVEYNKIYGWTSEGANGAYWLQPFAFYSTTPVPPPPQVQPQPVSCYVSATPRLSVGSYGQVAGYPYRAPNNVRTAPSITATRIAQIPTGGRFLVLEGPSCSNDIAWFKVRYGNIEGWTAESQNGTYYLEPA